MPTDSSPAAAAATGCQGSDRIRALVFRPVSGKSMRTHGPFAAPIPALSRGPRNAWLMIALVRIALSRPYTFVVLALLLLIIGPLAALRTPTDIFPDIRIPVIGVVWQYTGLPPDQMAGRITTPFQRALTTTVNDIEHIVANSYNGFGIVKIFFQPNVDIRTANAQVTAISQTLIKQMPPGATPPLILNYSASTVPIIQVALSGEGLTEQNLADIGINQLRTPLVTVPGAAVPYPVVGGPQMAEYRAFILDEDGHIDRSVEFLCPDDEAAKKYVRQFVDGHDVELWQGNRQIATFDCELE